MIGFIFLLSVATAQNVTCYLVEADSGSRIQCSTQKPIGTIDFAPLDETGNPHPIEAVDLVDEEDPNTGELRKKAVLNQRKLQDKIAADSAREAQEKKRRDDKRKAKQDRMDRLKSLCPQQTGVLKDLCDEILDE